MIAIKGGKVLTITNGLIENGTILIENGKIADVGKNISIPDGVITIDAANKWIMPGLIDAHTHITVFGEPATRPDMPCDGNEMCDPICPDLSIRDSINPDDESITKVRNAGFTTVYVSPGSSNVVGGTGVTLKLRGRTVDEMEMRGHEHMKIAFGENPKHAHGMNNRSPFSRMAIAAMLRNILEETKRYSEQLDKAEDDIFKKPKYNSKLEAMIKVVKGEQRVRIHCHRADDIMTSIRICEEYGLVYSLEHVTEGYKIADILGRKRVSCVVGPLLFAPIKREVWGLKLENACELVKEGVEICLTADEGVGTAWLPVHIGMLIARGLPEAEAFKAVTINPARLLGIDAVTGSIEVGKNADIAIFNGHPFSNMSLCCFTMIDGKIYHNTL